MRCGLFLLAILPALAESPSDRIGSIDFYGYGHLDVASMRAALPFKEGDGIPSDAVRESAVRALSRITGRRAVVSGVCCLPDGRSSIFVGLPEVGAPLVVFNPAPQGDAKLPAEALRILGQFDKHFAAAVKRGAAQEDDSQGYALFSDPATHADQLKLRDWTRGHSATVLHVLAGSRDSEQRADAAQALGYADRSPEQIAALVTAAFDSDDGVRNNAVRALQALCAVGPEVTKQIPAARFIPLLHSVEWKDRNKGAMLLVRMTDSRDSVLLKMLHDEALDPLCEMAQWKDFGHAWFSLTILGRIAGMEESRLDRLDASMAGDIVRAAR
jgi:HEAT repeat protein